jgi:pyrroline-5-carboxylate reductase
VRLRVRLERRCDGLVVAKVVAHGARSLTSRGPPVEASFSGSWYVAAMALDTDIAFIGGGQMAFALAQGLIRAGIVPAVRIRVSEPVAAQREKLERELTVTTVSETSAALRGAKIVVLATKPQVMGAVLADVSTWLEKDALVVSIVAGVPLATMESALPKGTRVIRTMPNTPALVGAAATGIARGAHATDADLETARTLFDAVGASVVVAESLLDAVTGLSGSGPAYVYLFIEALADGGVRSGLPRDAAMRLAAQTVLGSAQMVLETKKHPGELKDMVTSPGGTTIAGVHTLEEKGFRGAVISAVKAATDRSAELGAAAKK